eukprot:jgi/Mesvir1/290/Mv13620-RA.1
MEQQSVDGRRTCRKRKESASAPSVAALAEKHSTGKLLFFTGSGMSVAAGMSTFTKPGGLYERACKRFRVGDGMRLFHHSFYQKNRDAAEGFLREIYDEAVVARPTASHRALRALEACGRLRRHYTLNIDGLATAAGASLWDRWARLQGATIEMHGNVREMVCTRCRTRYDRASLEPLGKRNCLEPALAKRNRGLPHEPVATHGKKADLEETRTMKKASLKPAASIAKARMDLDRASIGQVVSNKMARGEEARNGERPLVGDAVVIKSPHDQEAVRIQKVHGVEALAAHKARLGEALSVGKAGGKEALTGPERCRNEAMAIEEACGEPSGNVRVAASSMNASKGLTKGFTKDAAMGLTEKLTEDFTKGFRENHGEGSQPRQTVMTTARVGGSLATVEKEARPPASTGSLFSIYTGPLSFVKKDANARQPPSPKPPGTPAATPATPSGMVTGASALVPTCKPGGGAGISVTRQEARMASSPSIARTCPRAGQQGGGASGAGQQGGGASGAGQQGGGASGAGQQGGGASGAGQREGGAQRARQQVGGESSGGHDGGTVGTSFPAPHKPAVVATAQVPSNPKRKAGKAGAQRPAVCTVPGCAGGPLRSRVMLYDDKDEASIVGPEVMSMLEEDIEAADVIIWAGISFQQSASVEYFRRVRRILQEQGRASAVPQLILNPSDETMFNLVTSIANFDELAVTPVLATCDEFIPRLVQGLETREGGEGPEGPEGPEGLGRQDRLKASGGLGRREGREGPEGVERQEGIERTLSLLRPDAPDGACASVCMAGTGHAAVNKHPLSRAPMSRGPPAKERAPRGGCEARAATMASGSDRSHSGQGHYEAGPSSARPSAWSDGDGFIRCNRLRKVQDYDVPREPARALPDAWEDALGNRDVPVGHSRDVGPQAMPSFPQAFCGSKGRAAEVAEAPSGSCKAQTEGIIGKRLELVFDRASAGHHRDRARQFGSCAMGFASSDPGCEVIPDSQGTEEEHPVSTTTITGGIGRRLGWVVRQLLQRRAAISCHM